MNSHHQLLTSIIPPPASYLEIGCCEGASLAAVIKAHPDLQSVVICDTWGNDDGGSGRGNHEHITALLKHLKFKGEVHWLDGRSDYWLPRLLGQPCDHSQYDLISVDGDHSFQGAFIDLLLAWELLAPAGHIVFDDIDHPDHPYLITIAERFEQLKQGQINSLWFRSPPNPEFGAVRWQKCRQ